MGVVRFDQIARECRETFKGSIEGKPIVGLEHIEPYDMLLKNYDVDVETTFTKSFKKGQILFGRRRAYQHKACVATCDGICSGDITVIEPIEDAVYPDLLPFIIQNDDFFEHAIKGSNGALSPRVKWEHMANFEVDLPSIYEQKVLADKLWAAYEVKQSYLKMIDATDEMVNAQFIEMFGNSTTDKKWNIMKLQDIVHPDCPISYGIVQPGEGYETGVPVVRPVDLNINYYVYRDGLKLTTEEISNSYKRTILRGDEILLCVRGTTGLMGIATEELKGCNVTRGITPLYFKEGFNRYYILGVFLSEEIQNYIKRYTIGSTLKGINMERVRVIPVPIPPYELQCKYELVFKQADKSKAELRKSIDAIDKVIKSLINENL